MTGKACTPTKASMQTAVGRSSSGRLQQQMADATARSQKTAGPSTTGKPAKGGMPFAATRRSRMKVGKGENGCLI
jgi:hypothetical protein